MSKHLNITSPVYQDNFGIWEWGTDFHISRRLFKHVVERNSQHTGQTFTSASSHFCLKLFLLCLGEISVIKLIYKRNNNDESHHLGPLICHIHISFLKMK